MSTREHEKTQCPTVEQLADYQVGALPLAQTAVVREHVKACAACRQELAALARVEAAVSRLPEPPAPEDLWPGVAARLTRRPRPTFLSGWRRVAFGAAMAAGLVFAGVTAERASRPAPPPLTPSYVAEAGFLNAQDPLADRAGIAIALAARDGDRP